MKTMIRSAEVDQDAKVKDDRLMYFGIYLLVWAILGLLWFFSATFGMIAGLWGMSGAVVLWRMQ